MWANHTYIDCHPFAPGKHFGNAPVWRRGELSRTAFDRHTADAIKRYFTQPNYWKIEGRPYFSIFDPHNLLMGLGGVRATRAALDSFRERTKAASFPGLHLNFVEPDAGQVPDRGQGAADAGRSAAEDRNRKRPDGSLGGGQFDLVHVGATGRARWPGRTSSRNSASRKAGFRPRFSEPMPPRPDYRPAITLIGALRPCVSRSNDAARLGIPFFPHVAHGWDGSPRNYGGGIVVGSTPERFRHFLIEAKATADRQPESNGIITINSWNEWVEGSYLEPDTIHGMAYLEAIRDVFGAGR